MNAPTIKPTAAELMEDTGMGLDYGTRPDRMPGYLTPTRRAPCTTL